MTAYRKEEAGDGGWSRWIQPVRRGYKLCCCDCGLVHNVDFRIRKGRVQFRVSRNNRSTALVRRHSKTKATRYIPAPAKSPKKRKVR